MLDLNWLSQEARNIHDVFYAMFYAFVTVLLLLGVVSDYFKMPMGTLPGGPQLVGRAVVAAILLHSYPEITNTLSAFTDSLCEKIGGFNDFHLVLDRTGAKLKEFAWSWTSIKETLILAFSFLTFFLLYISVFIANAGVVYVWLILYVFSPLLIALFVLPATASATSTLFRSLFEVCAWKIVWAVLAALLWSSALGQMSRGQSELNFLTVISYNLILAISLLFTPMVVNALVSKGLSHSAGSWLGVAAGAAAFAPGVLAKAAVMKSGKIAGSGVAKAGGFAFSSVKRQFFDQKKMSKVAGGARMNSSTAPMPKPPAWHAKVPPPKEPPGWMQWRIDRDKNQNRNERK